MRILYTDDMFNDNLIEFESIQSIESEYIISDWHIYDCYTEKQYCLKARTKEKEIYFLPINSNLAENILNDCLINGYYDIRKYAYGFDEDSLEDLRDSMKVLSDILFLDTAEVNEVYMDKIIYKIKRLFHIRADKNKSLEFIKLHQIDDDLYECYVKHSKEPSIYKGILKLTNDIVKIEEEFEYEVCLPDAFYYGYLNYFEKKNLKPNISYSKGIENIDDIDNLISLLD